jgi:acetyl esterase
MNHTVKDAVMDLIKENNIPVPKPLVDTMGKEIDVIGGKIHARIYTPQLGTGPFPIIVYYHGGGWVIANIDVYDASAQALAEKVGAVVVSVEYRRGPEFKFPTAHEDAYAAYMWAVNNAASINGNPMKVGVAGESAGGNLAANVSIMARDKGFQMPAHQLLVYPVANSDLNSDSFILYANAKPLDKPAIPWFLMHYLNNMSEAMDPRISLVKANLSNLPSTTIISAEIDPLQTEGLLLKQKLMEAGNKVTGKLYLGTTHEFFGTAILVPDAKDAQDYAASEFKAAFGM